MPYPPGMQSMTLALIPLELYLFITRLEVGPVQYINNNQLFERSIRNPLYCLVQNRHSLETATKKPASSGLLWLKRR